MFACPPEEDAPPVLLRVLCLGNDLLADDALGAVVAGRLAAQLPPDVEVVASSTTGFGLLDDLLNTARLVVVDSIRSGGAPPGTLYQVREEDLRCPVGGSAHYVGLFEMLALARALHLPAPQKVVILAVEAADCTTVGGTIHPAVQAAVPAVIRQVEQLVQEWRREAA
ncbi:MAG TPA: hydrogenase maturation protease [Dehalococcoidia bacterium]|nr:hydrogenase maturation protease [Dehalococcoidia bacterium]